MYMFLKNTIEHTVMALPESPTNRIYFVITVPGNIQENFFRTFGDFGLLCLMTNSI